MPDLLTIGLFVVLAVMVVFMFRSSRKRQREQAEMQSKFVEGAEIMTTTGIYGTIVSIDDDKNEAVIESTPGTQLRVHRQALAKVVEPEVEEPVDADEAAETEIDGVTAPDDARELLAEPEFGERTATDRAAEPADAAADEPGADGKKPRN